MRAAFVLIPCCLAAMCGCATYAETSAADAPYAATWEALAQSSSGLAAKARIADMDLEARLNREKRLKGYRYHRQWSQDSDNVKFKKKFDRAIDSPKTVARELDDLRGELAYNRMVNIQRAGVEADPEYIEWLDEFYKVFQEKLEEKVLELLRIEPTISIADGTGVKVAIVEIGERIRTVRYDERERWRTFFEKAGFAVEPVFLPAFVVGNAITSDTIRMAAARAGAGAVLAYTTTTETEVSPLGESVAVLAFAKCMFIDTRTEYLYFNAEGEGKDRKITLPGMLDVVGFERQVVGKAVEGLRSEINHELERLRAEK